MDTFGRLADLYGRAAMCPNVHRMCVLCYVSSVTPPPPPGPVNWAAVAQNCLAIVAVSLFAILKLISGNAALLGILAIVGVIVYPALRRNGGSMGSIGVLAFAKPFATSLAVFLARLS
jgi:hypothetical protein